MTTKPPKKRKYKKRKKKSLRKFFTKEQKEAILQMIRQGCSTTDICNTIGCERTLVWRMKSGIHSRADRNTSIRIPFPCHDVVTLELLKKRMLFDACNGDEYCATFIPSRVKPPEEWGPPHRIWRIENNNPKYGRSIIIRLYSVERMYNFLAKRIDVGVSFEEVKEIIRMSRKIDQEF